MRAPWRKDRDRQSSEARLRRFRHEAEGPAEALLLAVRAGAVAEVAVLLPEVADADRRGLLPELKRLRTTYYELPGRAAEAVFLAGAGCHTGAVACANWLTSSLSWCDHDTELLAAALAGRSAAFRETVVTRMAARDGLSHWQFRLICRLAESAGVAVPVTEGTAEGWLGGYHQAVVGTGCDCPRPRRFGEPAPAGAPAPATPCTGLLDRLRADLHTPRMVLHLLDTPGRLNSLTWVPGAHGHPWDSWEGALARLAEEGVLERSALIATAVAVLLRGSHPKPDVRFCTDLLTALALTEDERLARTTDWIRAAADAPSATAGFAQELLQGLWEAELLPAEALAECSAEILFRPEKKLVRTQLGWLSKAMRRAPQDVPLLLPTVGDAFGHPDVALVERALKLAGRFLRHADEDAREALRAAAQGVGPSLLPLAAELLGAPELVAPPEDREPHTDVLPAVPEPGPLPAPADEPLVFAAEFAALLGRGGAPGQAGSPSGAALDWALDGLVRLAHRDRAALVEALKPVAEPHRYWLDQRRWLRSGHPGLLLPLAAVLGFHPAEAWQSAHRRAGTERCVHPRFGRLWRDRLFEVARLLVPGTVPPPLLLATPGLTSGALEPAELLDRLRTYRDQDVRAGRIDLELALLRLRHHPERAAEYAAQARALGTPEGDRLAGRLTAGPLPPLPAPVRRAGREKLDGRVAVLLDAPPAPELASALPALAELAAAHRTATQSWCVCGSALPAAWATLLPGQPDVAALHLLPELHLAGAWDSRADTRTLVALAEQPGPAGPALRLALAYALGARHAEDRLGAVDALLMLAARGELDATGLAADLAELLAAGAVKPNRIAHSLATAGTAGAPATAWSVLAALLPPLLAAPTPPRGLAELLAAAAECVEACGAPEGTGDELPGLADLASTRSSTRRTVEARRLHQALTG